MSPYICVERHIPLHFKGMPPYRDVSPYISTTTYQTVERIMYVSVYLNIYVQIYVYTHTHIKIERKRSTDETVERVMYVSVYVDIYV